MTYDYFLALDTDRSDRDVEAMLSSVLAGLEGVPASVIGRALSVDVEIPGREAEVYAEIGIQASVLCCFSIDLKSPDSFDAGRAAAIAALRIVELLDADAALTRYFENVLLRRLGGVLTLFEVPDFWEHYGAVDEVRGRFEVSDWNGHL